MSKLVPFNSRSGTSFSLDGHSIVLSSVTQNPIDEMWYMDISWDNKEHIYGLRVTSGVDLVQQFPACPLPNLYAINLKDPTSDIISVGSLQLVIISPEV